MPSRRGTPKAPPLPTEIWDKDRYVGHPHEVAQVYLKEWGSFREEFEYAEHDQLWLVMRQIIKRIKKEGDRLDEMTNNMLKTASINQTKGPTATTRLSEFRARVRFRGRVEASPSGEAPRARSQFSMCECICIQ